MPQIKDGDVKPGQNGAPELYGVGQVQNNVPFQEKLMNQFKPQEFVLVKNIDSDPCYWQYLDLDSEQESFSEDGMQKIIHRDDPQMWVINPGITEVVVGASAYRALDVMYKNYTAKATLRKFNDPESRLFDENGKHIPRNFNFADSGAQDAFIRAAYLGKATPTFSSEQPVAQDTPNQTPQTPPSQPTNPPAPTPTVPTPAAAAPASSILNQVAVPQPNSVIDTDPNLPKPKTTEGAPLAPVTYAEPDAEPAPAARETVSAAGPKK